MPAASRSPWVARHPRSSPRPARPAGVAVAGDGPPGAPTAGPATGAAARQPARRSDPAQPPSPPPSATPPAGTRPRPAARTGGRTSPASRPAGPPPPRPAPAAPARPCPSGSSATHPRPSANQQDASLCTSLPPRRLLSAYGAAAAQAGVSSLVLVFSGLSEGVSALPGGDRQHREGADGPAHHQANRARAGNAGQQRQRQLSAHQGLGLYRVGHQRSAAELPSEARPAVSVGDRRAAHLAMGVTRIFRDCLFRTLARAGVPVLAGRRRLGCLRRRRL